MFYEMQWRKHSGVSEALWIPHISKSILHKILWWNKAKFAIINELYFEPVDSYSSYATDKASEISVS